MPQVKKIRPYPSLFAWRKDNHLSQQEAAQILGVAQTSYSRLERGERFVKRTKVQQFVELTGVPIEVLLGIAS